MFHKHLTILFLLLLIHPHTHAQTWVKTADGAYKISHLFFQEVMDIVKGTDSNYYVVIRHEQDRYWRKKWFRRKKQGVLVSKIDNAGNISLVARPDAGMYAPITSSKRSMVYAKGSKFYILDNGPVEKSYLYVYDSLWQLTQTIQITLPEHQDGIYQFEVQKNGRIWALTHAYRGWKSPRHSNALLKLAPHGREKMLMYDSMELSNLQIDGDSLSFMRQRFYSRYKQDSTLQSMHCDTNLNCTIGSIYTEQAPPAKLPPDPGDTTIAIEPGWHIKYSRRLSANLTWIELEKEHDSAKVVLYNPHGKSKILRQWKRTNESSDTLIFGFSYPKTCNLPATNSIGLFYKISYTDRHEELFFESLPL